MLKGHPEKAKELFLSGYNCAQAVFCAFAEELGISTQTALALSSSFGAGMGRMRLVCGTQSGAYMVLGAYYGHYDPKDRDAKARHYQRIREVAEQFKMINQSLICQDILKNAVGTVQIGGIPEERNAEYYTQRRVCSENVWLSAKLAEDYINAHPIKEREDKNRTGEQEQ